MAFFGFVFVTDVSVVYAEQVQPVLNQIIGSLENSTTTHGILVFTVDLLNGIFIGIPGKEVCACYEHSNDITSIVN